MLKLLVLQKKSGDLGISWAITTVTLIQQQLNSFFTNLRNPSTKFSKTTSRQKSTLVQRWYHTASDNRF
jgi:hypothetical protein